MQLQLQQGAVSDAFSTAERLRARNFVEQLGGRATVPLSAGDRRMEAELRERALRLNRAATETSSVMGRETLVATCHMRSRRFLPESEYGVAGVSVVGSGNVDEWR